MCLHVELDASTNILIGDEMESSFRVSWDHTQAEIDGYMLTNSSSEGSSEEIPIGPDTSSNTLAGLMPGLHYAVSIWAINQQIQQEELSTSKDRSQSVPSSAYDLGHN